MGKSKKNKKKSEKVVQVACVTDSIKDLDQASWNTKIHKMCQIDEDRHPETMTMKYPMTLKEMIEQLKKYQIKSKTKTKTKTKIKPKTKTKTKKKPKPKPTTKSKPKTAKSKSKPKSTKKKEKKKPKSNKSKSKAKHHLSAKQHHMTIITSGKSRKQLKSAKKSRTSLKSLKSKKSMSHNHGKMAVDPASQQQQQQQQEGKIAHGSIRPSKIEPADARMDESMAGERIIMEFFHFDLGSLKHKRCNPERFLVAASKPEQHYLDRQVNVPKLYEYFVNYMDSFYDLTKSHDPFVSWREALDEKLWDSLAYLIPLLCSSIIQKHLKKESICPTIKGNCLVFGDIHGNLNDIHYIHRTYFQAKQYDDHKIIFLGDYVDRGPKSLEVVMFLLILKLMDPKRVWLLRGNHEVVMINRRFGFKCLIENIYSKEQVNNDVLHKFIYKSINDVFNNLPLAAVVRVDKSQKGIFCCHGGIPNESYNKNKPWLIKQLNDMTATYKPNNPLVRIKNCSPSQLALNEILWNEPITSTTSTSTSNKKPAKDDQLFLRNDARGGYCSLFTKRALKRFLDANHLRLVIRADQYECCKHKGYFYNFTNRKLLTVFSSSNYGGVEKNPTGLVQITREKCQAKVLRTSEESMMFHAFNRFSLVLDPKTDEVINVLLC